MEGREEKAIPVAWCPEQVHEALREALPEALREAGLGLENGGPSRAESRGAVARRGRRRD